MLSKTAQSQKWQKSNQKSNVMQVCPSGNSHLLHQVNPIPNKSMEKVSNSAESVVIGLWYMIPILILEVPNHPCHHLPTTITKRRLLSNLKNLTAWDHSARVVEANKSKSTIDFSLTTMLIYLYIMTTVSIYMFGLTIPALEDLYYIAASMFQHTFQQIYNYHCYLMTTVAPTLWFILG